MTFETILQGKDFSLLSKDNGVFLLRKGSPSSKKILETLREHLPSCEVNVKALLLALKNETMRRCRT
jgi:hypothetical protein